MNCLKSAGYCKKDTNCLSLAKDFIVHPEKYCVQCISAFLHRILFYFLFMLYPCIFKKDRKFLLCLMVGNICIVESLQLKHMDCQRLPGRTKTFLRSMTTRPRKGNSPNPCTAALPGSILRSSLTGSFGSFHAWMHARASRSNMQPRYFYLFGKSRKHISRKKSTIRKMLTSTDRTLCLIVNVYPAGRKSSCNP